MQGICHSSNATATPEYLCWHTNIAQLAIYHRKDNNDLKIKGVHLAHHSREDIVENLLKCRNGSSGWHSSFFKSLGMIQSGLHCTGRHYRYPSQGMGSGAALQGDEPSSARDRTNDRQSDMGGETAFSYKHKAQLLLWVCASWGTTCGHLQPKGFPNPGMWIYVYSKVRILERVVLYLN